MYSDYCCSSGVSFLLRQLFGLSGLDWIKITRNQNKQKNKLKKPIQSEVEKHGKTIQKRKKLNE